MSFSVVFFFNQVPGTKNRVLGRSKNNADFRLHRMCCSAVPDPSGSGRVDVLTSPVAAARAAVATGAWVKSKHDTYLIRRSVGA